ncbi:MAG TPA: hypothetical protein VGS97_24420 [Actinocrinis sp.]|uniref:hypothetical protein n=1 Tax=Actinocrinis sp. TaxID=1920516 RepID=UPI002DDD46ED|nr:hypothetical protein [Actinocrinis sp.]HEV2347264.1 hypothetical protein [Actinocrinis sp.]
MRTSRFDSCVAAFGAVALVAVAATGCASSSSGSAASAFGAASQSGNAGGSPSPTGIAAKLLSPGDLPSGWSVDAASPDAPQTADCPLLNATLWNAPLADRGEVDLSRGLGGPFLVEVLAAGSADQAGKAWRLLVSGVPKCTTYTHSSAAGKSTFTIAKAALPGFGDGSYSFTLSVAIAGGVSASGNIVAVHTNNCVVVVYLVGISGVTQSTVEDAVGRAVAKART